MTRLSIFAWVAGLTMLATPSPAHQMLAEKERRALASGEVVVLKARRHDASLVGGTALGLVDAPLARTWEAVNDFNRFAEFMPRLRVARLIDTSVETSVRAQERWDRRDLEALIAGHSVQRAHGERVLFYNVLDAPLPVRDRWYLLDMQIDANAHRVGWTLLAGNLKATEGSWELTAWPDDANRTLAAYTSYSDTGLPLPAFVVRMALTSTLPGVLQGLRRHLAQEAR